MPRRRRVRKAPIEIYPLERSPFAQNPTQRDIAALAGLTKDELLRQALIKDEYIIRRTQVINGKERDLAYPSGPLRATHERWKYHLRKIEQPDYLMSPRKGRSQRDNAAAHLSAMEYLTLDLRKFYPSTTYRMVQRYFTDQLGVYPDVARRIAEISTVDGVVSFGSPLTPVLVSTVHRPMFDQIDSICRQHGLTMTLWVDDITISGPKISGEAIRGIRAVISSHGHRSHKVRLRRGRGVVFITGVGVVASQLVAPKARHLKVKKAWAMYHTAETFEGREAGAETLLSLMGGIRHIVGASSTSGQVLASRMNCLRRDRDKDRAAYMENLDRLREQATSVVASSDELPWLA